MTLSNEVLEQVKGNIPLKTQLAMNLGVSVYTVERWIIKNSKKLATPAALKVITSHLKIRTREALAN